MRKIRKQSKEEKDKLSKLIYLIICGILATILFLILIGRIAYIQFVKGKEYKQAAYNIQVKDKIISPNRGTIYDANGEVLAQSISVDTVSINPGAVKYASGKKVDDEVIAEGFSSIFEMTKEEVLEKLDTKSSVVVMQKKVDTEKVKELKKWMSDKNITAGINIDEDTKRSYPYNNLASNLLGFCSDDNVGLFGIEERWNDVLTGTAGKVVTVTDITGQAISDEDEEYVPSENGSNIYLTIDATIQGIAEKYLKKAVTENNCTQGGNVIIMNPQNGNILAMATYPDYDLNSPRSYTNLGLTEEDWNSLESSVRTNKLYDLWSNKAVSRPYEPGSTFKLITAAVGLEEGFVSTDTAGDFFCSGSYVVDDYDIACWRKDNPHGSQTLREALENSCNPAFMQLGQRIGKNVLYKYFEAFGLFDTIGSNIAKSYPGTFHDIDKLVPVELATTSFGQRFEISPLHLATAVSAICNDGVLVEPRIVEKVENTDTGSIEVTDVKNVRQVISKTTSDKIKDMMHSVVVEGTGKWAKVEGYSIGGKSGTSEPRPGKEEDGYVASFISVSPIENTQVVVLVTLYDPTAGNYQGGQTAGPVTAEIMTEVLPYLGIPSSKTEENVASDDLVAVPNLENKTVAEAKEILTQYGFSANVNITGDENSILVTNQTPKPGTTLEKGSIISIQTTESDEKQMVTVPNIKEMTVVQARNELRARNLNLKIEDGKSGIVVSQDPSFETEVEEGTVINVVIKEKLKDGQ